ncbi:ATP-NAD kinase [Siculibacillus lacustris]|uniref:ATP-NAD kinase n=1 Tax=Siculibacillus lacustris TaxID=1549641 RepID=A0A4Q9VCK3_9HYPH|nr:NAD(+)/NADH kinase [Siculibacillus lacustris]TBW32172.1 ATP-NAD kinase [Siculibacillus lacustris]
MNEVAVGIIANPASGRDIRRLVAHGTVFDNQEKVSIVRRILLACEAAGVARIVYMPDYYRIVEMAREGMRSDVAFGVRLEPVPQVLTGLPQDTETAARWMADKGLGCIVTLGGDGTNRLIAKVCGDTPILPVSTGTNNVFPEMVEGTIAGLAAGVVARGETLDDALYRSKCLTIVKNGRTVDQALVDAVVLDCHFIGAKALWETTGLRRVVVTRGEPHNIGFASIVGCLSPITPHEPRGAWIDLLPDGTNLCAPIAPGLVLPVGVSDVHSLALGEAVAIEAPPCIVALDGEREVEFARGDVGFIRLEASGPWVVDVRRALAGAVRRGFFCDPVRLRRLAAA